jgi:centromere protein C
VRRGLRHRYKPLEWWRQEKVVYDNKGEDLVLVPHIKEIIRIPKEPVRPLSKHKRKRTAPPKSKSESESKEVVEEEEAEAAPNLVYNPEAGWDDKTEAQGIVIDFVGKQEVERRESFFW